MTGVGGGSPSSAWEAPTPTSADWGGFVSIADPSWAGPHDNRRGISSRQKIMTKPSSAAEIGDIRSSQEQLPRTRSVPYGNVKQQIQRARMVENTLALDTVGGDRGSVVSRAAAVLSATTIGRRTTLHKRNGMCFRIGEDTVRGVDVEKKRMARTSRAEEVVWVIVENTGFSTRVRVGKFGTAP